MNGVRMNGVLSDPRQESARFVIGHLLTKHDELTTREIQMLQTALMETGDAKFERANGVFGPGTVQAVISYVSKPENLEIVPRLSFRVEKAIHDIGDPIIAAQAKTDIIRLQQKALEGGRYDPTLVREGTTVASLLSQPYPFTRPEMEFLQKELGVKVDGEAHHETINAIAKYIKEHPEAHLENPAIVAYMSGKTGTWNDTLREMARNSDSYKQELAALKPQVAQAGPLSSVTYHAQYMLAAGGYMNVGSVDGAKGQVTNSAFAQFSKDIRHEDSLRTSWDEKGRLGEQPVLALVEPEHAEEPVIAFETPKGPIV